MLSLQSFLRKGESLGHVRRNQNLKDLQDAVSHLNLLCTGAPDVTRKEVGPSTEQIPVSTYVGSAKNLKDLKDLEGGEADQKLTVCGNNRFCNGRLFSPDGPASVPENSP